MLTDMMGGSPVLVVESLAKAPKDMLAAVYFDHPAGTSGYTPLRAIHQVRWKNASAARELKSAAEIRKAEASGEITIATPGIVVNMPMLTCPVGSGNRFGITDTLNQKITGPHS